MSSSTVMNGLYCPGVTLNAETIGAYIGPGYDNGINTLTSFERDGIDEYNTLYENYWPVIENKDWDHEVLNGLGEPYLNPNLEGME